jgi:hypothetical protein
VSAELDRELVEAELEGRVEWAHARGHVYDAAVWQLVAGRAKEGLESLRATVTACPDADAPAVDPRWAVVAGEPERAARAARDLLRLPSDFVPGYREYIRTLYAVIADDPETASESLEALRAVAGERRGGAPAGAVEILGGLVERSPQAVEAGVEALLAWHLRRGRARSEIFNSARAAVSLDAIVTLLLAHARGFSIDVREQFRAAAIPLLVLHVREWRGEPLPDALPLRLHVDLVAGEWLRMHGLSLAAAPPARAAARPRQRRPLATDVDEAVARSVLEERTRAGRGSRLQLSCWTLMLGDTAAARRHLVEAAEAARRQWRESTPPGHLLDRILASRTGLPNQNHLREHFALALTLRDEEAVAETAALLRAWDERRPLDDPYRHTYGYLDLIRHLLDGLHVSRNDAETVLGLLSDIRVACVGLADGTPELVARGVRGMLQQHAAALERKTSPDLPICFPAAHVAVAAEQLGLEIELGDEYRSWSAPVVLSERAGKVGRMPVDLLGTPLWHQ